MCIKQCNTDYGIVYTVCFSYCYYNAKHWTIHSTPIWLFIAIQVMFTWTTVGLIFSHLNKMHLHWACLNSILLLYYKEHVVLIYHRATLALKVK